MLVKATLLISNTFIPGTLLSTLFYFLLCPASLAARDIESGGIFSEWKISAVDYSSKPFSIKLDCASLSDWSEYPAQVLFARKGNRENGLPEYCDVLGHIQSNIKFRLFLPARWNGRFFMVGNGGLAGDDLLQPQYPQHLKKMQAAIRHGFATVMTDSGHAEKETPGGSFAHNNFSSEMDFAFRAIHAVSETSKQLIEYVYEETPQRNYFDGCSGGGRQGLMSVQRYPNDFHGVVAGAPAFNHTAFAVGRMVFNPILNDAAISMKQVSLLGKLITAECDENDGLKDGLIENPLSCKVNFDKLLPVCSVAGSADNCFSEKQVSAIKLLHEDVYVNGERLQPGYPPGSDLSQSNGWHSWLPTDDPNKFDFGRMYSEELLRYIAFDKDDPARSLKDFDAARDVKNFGLAMRLIDATNPNIDRYHKAGGKLLMYIGWQDMAFSPRATVEYYEELSKRYQEDTTEFVRLFMAPGMYHCFGGTGPNKFDYMTPLLNWVEKGIAPRKIIAHQFEDNELIRSRPLCPWPALAIYRGKGPVNVADSYTCQSPR